MDTGEYLISEGDSSASGVPVSTKTRPSKAVLALKVFAVVATAVFALVALNGDGVASAQDDSRFNNDTCLGCHDVPSLEVPLPSGEILNAVVDRETYEESVHGQLDLPCVLCHTDIEGFPHPELASDSLRDFTVERYTSCFGCHQGEYTATLDNVHADARDGGNPEAAVCTDCHGAHDVAAPSHRAADIVQTCRSCHSEVYDLYADSVHGAALTNGNTDVPTCTDCHGVHDSEGPTDAGFHLFSPQICAECHADKELMGDYGISTDVFDTYVADFHGSTVVLFEELTPDQDTNKPVCIDCHGVHQIGAADDPTSTVFQENLLGTCQRCHPDATSNFPAAWLSHYPPTPGGLTLVSAVRLFYRILIPLVIGVMVLYIVTDLVPRVRARRKVARVQHG